MNGLNKSDDPTAPKNQRIDDAPHNGRNEDGDIVADATESAGQDSAWESSGDLTPENSDETGVDGFTSGPGTFENIPDGSTPHFVLPEAAPDLAG